MSFINNEDQVLKLKKNEENLTTIEVFFSKLPTSDQFEYTSLLNYFKSLEITNKKNLGMINFKNHLSLIQNFIQKGDYFDTYRGFVCGIIHSERFLIVNTYMLKHILSRSKSCVNSSLHKIGYKVSSKHYNIPKLFSYLFCIL